ncbi:hypothetical protein APR41_17625 [Salegentibacter salinarum]|uniref:Uncharacterized protein n=1 Tax=Salegentibacter salinarum TaxID=447422 RepID=A0A2N0TVG9_9FLAO|nr:hypothetical protein [Salegentibacter salinarum]PKD18730.1 hypothetical protein APR41_17625 [Salegentibacter salinarum]SKB98703.1 hypothetical protein SAMN05660903_03651 [Salegentibacter salinarum]
MKLKSEKVFGYIIAGIIVLVFSYMVTKNFIKKSYFDNSKFEKRITIGEINKIVPGAKSPPFFEYEFIVNDDSYGGAYIIESDLRRLSTKELKKFVGKKFYVKYVEKDPNYNKLLFNEFIKDTTLSIPSSGWSEIPE